MTDEISRAQVGFNSEDYPSSQKLLNASLEPDRYGYPCLRIYDGDVTKETAKKNVIKFAVIDVIVTAIYLSFLNSLFLPQDSILIRIFSFLSHAAVFAFIFWGLFKATIRKSKHNDEIRLTHCYHILRVSKYYFGVETLSKSFPVNDSLSIKNGVLSVDYEGFASTTPQHINGSIDFLTCINQESTNHIIEDFLEDVKNICKKNRDLLVKQNAPLPFDEISARFAYFKKYCDICKSSKFAHDCLSLNLIYTRKTFLSLTFLVLILTWPFSLLIVFGLGVGNLSLSVNLTMCLFVNIAFCFLTLFLSSKEQKTHTFHINETEVAVSSENGTFRIPLERFLPAEFEMDMTQLAKIRESYTTIDRIVSEGIKKKLRLFDADGDLTQSRAFAIEDKKLVPWFVLIIDTINDPIWTKELPPEPVVEEIEPPQQQNILSNPDYAPYNFDTNAIDADVPSKKSYHLEKYINAQWAVTDTDDITPFLNQPPVFDDEKNIAPSSEHIALLGKYHNLTPIGSGAQASMFRALDNQNQPVGIKVFDFRRFNGWKDEDLFEREVNILKKLHFKGIPKYIELINHNPLFYLVESYIPAPSMAKRIKQGERLTFEQALTVLINIAEILNYLDTRTPPVIHRDIKPENLLVDDQYNVWLVDFGVVAADVQKTNAMTFAGTAGYMAPEQLCGKVTPAADIYATGIAILVYMTGKSPDNMISDDLTIDVDKELPPNVPNWFRQLLSDMTQPAPDDRIQHAAQIAAIINDCLQ